MEDKVSGASSAGAGCFTDRCSRWAKWRGHLDEDVGEDAVVSACRGFCSVSLFRGLSSGVLYILGLTILELWHIGRLLDGKTASRPAELVKDGDLILPIRLRGTGHGSYL